MRTACLLLLALFAWSAAAQPAAAVLAFYKVFDAEYMADHPNEEFVKLVKKPANRCYVCHVGKKRTHRNEFGTLLEEPLDGKKDAKDKEKIAAAIKDALAQHVDPNDESSETYADRLSQGKFPAGELDELKKEPTDAE